MQEGRKVSVTPTLMQREYLYVWDSATKLL